MELDEKLPEIAHENHLLTIWTRPQQTLQYILTYSSEKYVIPLFVLGGIARAIDRASVKNLGDTMSTAAVLGLSVTMGAIFGWVVYYIYAALLSYTGKLIKGSADSEQFRTVLAWATVPTIFSLFLLVPQLLILGGDIFRSEPEHTGTFIDIMWMVFGLMEITLAIWSITISVKGIALIQRFSSGKAFFNLVLPALVIVVPLLLIAFILSLFR
jgi:hypothetical protein